MSRESDIQALKQLRMDIDEAEAFAKIGREEWEKSEKYRQEFENTKFVFNPLPTNNEETTRAKFTELRKKRLQDTSHFKRIFLIIYTLLMFAVSAVLLMDFMGQRGWIFTDTAFIYSDNSSGEMLLINIGSIAFFLSALLLPWMQIKDKLSETVFGILKIMIVGYVIGGLIFWYTAWNTQSMFILYAYLIATAAAFVLGFIIHRVCLQISKKPKISAKQEGVLAAERQKDIDNAALNKTNEEKEKGEWEAWWAKHSIELRDKVYDYINRAEVALAKSKEHLAKVNESDILGESDKGREVIDWLIYAIESRRADNIKEALHEYDAMKQNQKLLEIEIMKAQVEIERVKKEEFDRQREMEMNRWHQIEMEAQARRTADMQSQIAANTAAAAASAERMRKDAASASAAAAERQSRIAADVSAIFRNDYYNS